MDGRDIVCVMPTGGQPLRFSLFIDCEYLYRREIVDIPATCLVELWVYFGDIAINISHYRPNTASPRSRRWVFFHPSAIQS
jgi:hypothetical protein